MKTIAIIVLVALAAPRLAHAQASPEAEKLFRDGRELMKQNKLAEACGAFEASEKVEHNISTLLNLADCREKNQQLAAAWALFLAAESQTRGDASKAPSNAVAKQRAAALEPRLSYLTINVPDEARISDLSVTRDGETVDPAEYNRAIPIDGGPHTVAGRAPGHEPWSTTVTIGPTLDKQAVEVPKFKELPKLVHPEVDAQTAANGPGQLAGPAMPGAPLGPPPEPGMMSRRRGIALGLAGGALLGVGFGIGFGLSANNLHDQAVSTCPSASCTATNASAAQSQNESARHHATYSDVGFIAGGAIAAGAVALWVLGAPELAAGAQVGSVHVAPAVGATNGISISGRF